MNRPTPYRAWLLTGGRTIQVVSNVMSYTAPNSENKPRVSLIIPCHNEARTLPRTLDAVSRQRYPDFEVIIIDDGSTDDTAVIAGRFNDFTVIRHETNQGLSYAYNTGINASTGEIIGTLHADCIPQSDLWIETCIRHFVNPEIGIVGSPFIIPDETDIDFIKTIFMYVLRADSERTAVQETAPREISYISGKCDFYRGSVLREIGGFRPLSRVAGEDKDLSLRFRKRGLKILLEPRAPVIHLYGSHQQGLFANWAKAIQYGEVIRILFRLHGTIHSRDVLANIIITVGSAISLLSIPFTGSTLPLFATICLLLIKNCYKARVLLGKRHGLLLFAAAIPIGCIDNILMGAGVLKGPRAMGEKIP